MQFPLCKIPYKPCIDSSKCKFPSFSKFPGILHIIEDPPDFGCRKISIDNKTSFLKDLCACSIIFQLIAKICSTSVLPYNGIVHWFTCFPVPYYCSLTLIRNTNPGNVGTFESCLGNSLQSNTCLC